MKVAAAYIRVSTDDQLEYSPNPFGTSKACL